LKDKFTTSGNLAFRKTYIPPKTTDDIYAKIEAQKILLDLSMEFGEPLPS
jgi:hypothetical protein